jgi:hypothetical protein
MKNSKKRYLTKSRYKLALECPVKLFYTGKKEYANVKVEDPFLEALAQGGFQVEELARMEYPEGVLVAGEHFDYDGAIATTNELLQQENVVIFEAAFAFENLFIRTDILIKNGNNIELIEVKAKSFNPNDPNTFVGKRGYISSSWKPYLFDVAFQQYVIKKANPSWKIKAYLMLADKTKRAQIDGMNQLFRISKDADNRTGIVKLASNKSEFGETVLGKVCVDDIIDKIQQNDIKFKYYLDFEYGINLFAKHYQADEKINWPLDYNACKKCEFKCTDETKDKKSGFEICWNEKKGFTTDQFQQPNLFEVWNLRGQNYFEKHDIFFLKDVTEDIFKIEPSAGRISTSERQWIQIEKAVNNEKTPYVLKDELKAEMKDWVYPLHMIDFETSTVAIPFHKGMKPYEQVAFQFSHHIIHESGKVEHKSEYINFEKGQFPNFYFVRALKESLGTKGTVFRYSTHENSILNEIYVQLNESNEADKFELMEFIQQISHSKSDSVLTWKGARDMVDLCAIYKKYCYHPSTKGSNSIKAVLPAFLKDSRFLKDKYARPLGEINVSSSNFDTNHVWLSIQNGEVQNPYKMLQPLFQDWTNDQLDELLTDMEDLNNGGAALTAYGYLQYTNMGDDEREELRKGLLRYCELDTLGMVMIWEGLNEFINE